MNGESTVEEVQEIILRTSYGLMHRDEVRYWSYGISLPENHPARVSLAYRLTAGGGASVSGYRAAVWADQRKRGWAAITSADGEYPPGKPLAEALAELLKEVDAACLHERAGGRPAGACLAEYSCPDCGATFEVDSSG